MPTFDTPGPILVTLEIGVGDVRIAAGERHDTNVVVRPSNPARKSDVAAAEQTRVEFSEGRLRITAPKGWRHFTPRGGGDSIDVQIDLPAGSQLRGEAGVAALHCAGPIGECRYTTGVGDIQIDQAGPVHLTTGVGDVGVNRVPETHRSPQDPERCVWARWTAALRSRGPTGTPGSAMCHGTSG